MFITEEKFREILERADEQGQSAILMWRNPEERVKQGADESKMWVENAFAGGIKDGEPYGEYKEMALISAMEKYLELGIRFGVLTEGGVSPVVVGFKIKDLLYNRDDFRYAYSSIYWKYVNGPIVLIPSGEVVE